ncbi:MAG: hypothetical protein K6T94_26290 [Paenibacillus sp.]|nr:hypothetical protein [Paenibacillus sp.]
MCQRAAIRAPWCCRSTGSSADGEEPGRLEHGKGQLDHGKGQGVDPQAQSQTGRRCRPAREGEPKVFHLGVDIQTMPPCA